MYNSDQPPGYPRHVSDITDMTALKKHIDGYDCGIAYTDQHIGMLVEKLKAMGIYDDTAIILSADHGENQGELGLYAEHATADDITCHVPMIIKWPGMQGGVDSGFHYHLDWLPTVAELLGQNRQPEWDGESYADSLMSGDDCGRDSVVLSQCAHVCQRSLRFDHWIYIETRHCGFHLYPDKMLFDLEADPHEQHNLADTHPELCEEASARIASWRAEMLARAPEKPDPMDTVMSEGGPYHASTRLLPPYLERLRATERAEAADILEARYLGSSR
jgi:arylsulfatase A-like enzyme